MIALAVSLPMPELAPVMIATWSSNLNMHSYLLSLLVRYLSVFLIFVNPLPSYWQFVFDDIWYEIGRKIGLTRNDRFWPLGRELRHGSDGGEHSLHRLHSSLHSGLHSKFGASEGDCHNIPHLSFLEGPAKTALMEVEVIMASGHGSQYRSENLVVSSAKLKYKVNGIV